MISELRKSRKPKTFCLITHIHLPKTSDYFFLLNLGTLLLTWNLTWCICLSVCKVSHVETGCLHFFSTQYDLATYFIILFFKTNIKEKNEKWISLNTKSNFFFPDYTSVEVFFKVLVNANKASWSLKNIAVSSFVGNSRTPFLPKLWQALCNFQLQEIDNY